MKRPTGQSLQFLSLTAVAALSLPALAQETASPGAETLPEPTLGEKLPEWAFGPTVIEGMDVVLEREKLRTARVSRPKARNGAQGQWIVPSQRWTDTPHSGEHYTYPKWGDTRMGVGFGGVVALDGVWVAGHGAEGYWTKGLKVVGYLAGTQVAETEWFEDIDGTPSWFPIALAGVDRVEFVSRAVFEGGGFYSIDDLTFTRPGVAGAAASQVVIDFEDRAWAENLTGTDAAGLTWETGTGDFSQETVEVSPPMVPPGYTEEQGAEGEASDDSGLDGLGTAPMLRFMYPGPRQSDVGAGYIPPDTCGAVGTNHFVAAVNQNLSIYNKSTGVRVVTTSLQSFFNTGGSAGDPRVAFDPHHNRWIVLATNFSDRVRLAYSKTDDPTGSWIKKSIIVSLGSDTGAWPDYPTLGVDANGIYTSCYMVGNNYRMSVFCIDKAPLLAATPTLGTVTAFRQLPWEGAIQPAVTWGPAPGEYLISRNTSTRQRIRLVSPPLTAPTLTELGFATTIVGNSPPNAPALGSTGNLDTLGTRLMNSVYRDGSIWAAHSVNKGGRSAVNWYEIDAATATVVQQGTVRDPARSYFIPSIAVDSQDNVLLAFSGSSLTEYAGCWMVGREAGDPLGEMSDEVMFKPGGGAYNQSSGGGTNRWGDYSVTSLDPVDDTLWTIQEHARANGDWGTRIAQFEFGCGAAANYCTSGITASGCQASASAVGIASASAPSGFTIDITDVEGKKDGLIFWGSNGQQGNTWGNGTSFQCVTPPVHRTSLQVGVGTIGACDGSFALDFNTWMSNHPASAPVAGSIVQAQAWFRDPFNTSNQTTSLSDALEFSICP